MSLQNVYDQFSVEAGRAVLHVGSESLVALLTHKLGSHPFIFIKLVVVVVRMENDSHGDPRAPKLGNGLLYLMK